MKNKKTYTIRNGKTGRSGSKRLLWWLIGLFIVLIAGWIIYKVFFTTNPQPSVAIPANVYSVVNQNQPDTTDKTTSKTADSSSKTASSNPDQTIVNLASPSGDFVSSHEVSLSKSATIESTCNTTPGASCSISFTDTNGTVRYLASQTVDKNGAAYWSWSLNGAKLSAGSWQIKATATAGKQTKTTIDPLKLKVSP